ncbi:MAG: glycoside hydrolase family 130 protein [Bacteroidota bacterium]
MKAILGRIMRLSEEEAERVLLKVLEDFRNRHRNIEDVFRHRFNDLRPYLRPGCNPSLSMQVLIGAYFTCEYALEAAALFNPSIVPHPSQEGTPQGSLRFIMSLRATGEGHISSIEFRTGIISNDGTVRLDPRERFAVSPEVRQNPQYDKDEFMTKIADEDHLNPTTRGIFASLPKSFKQSELLASVARVKRKNKKLSPTRIDALKYIESLSELNYEISFPESRDLSENVIFPVSSYESNGIEDARFVRFANNGSFRYYATYTAYNGKQIMPLLLETDDFRHIRVRSLSGKAAKNKGMALFPRKIRGKHVMVSRQDGENLYCVYSNSLYSWQKPGVLLKPTYPWEFTQIGNCGSPIETEQGWLLLTHGVGPVRKYCIGAVLLDLEDPSKVIGQLKDPLIEPDESEREGYVPNVVYTCGAIAHKGRLVIPYALSDQSSRFASIEISELVDGME